MAYRRRLRTRALKLLAAASVSLATGCSDLPELERDTAPLLQTSALRYTLERHDIGYSATIPFTYRNDTGVDVLVDHCDGDVRPLLQVQRAGRWVDQWYPFQYGCSSPAIRIGPGETYSDTLRLIGAPPGSNVTPAFVFEDVEGVHRLYWFQARLSDSGADGRASGAASLPWRVSNPFVLTF